MPLPERFQTTPETPNNAPPETPDTTHDGGSIAGASASTRASARDYTTAEDMSTSERSVVPFPGADNPPAVTESDPRPVTERGKAAVTVWVGEARETATRTVDGSLYRARPASLRDRHTRLVRAEWAGGLPALAIPGRIYGYLIGLPAAVLLRLLDQIFDRPLRLIVTVICVVVPWLLTR